MYYLITLIRNWLYDHGILKSHSYDLPVICVGNLAVGGTGKTPHTEYIARLLMAQGWHVGILSRGYGRKTKGLRTVTTASTAAEVGDEPLQMYDTLHDKGRLTSIVCEDRHTGITYLSNKVDVVLMDDAFQHRRVRAGLQIVLTDSHRPYWHDHVLPYGRLREPRRGIRRADIVVVTKVENPDTELLFPLTQAPWFASKMAYGEPYLPHHPETAAGGITDEAHVLLVTGIAHPEPLAEYLQQRHLSVQHLRFGDHHAFSPQDMARIESAFSALDAPRYVITTAKDYERLKAYALSDALRNALWVQPITINFGTRTPHFNNIILDYVRQNIHNDR